MKHHSSELELEIDDFPVILPPKVVVIKDMVSVRSVFDLVEMSAEEEGEERDRLEDLVMQT